MDVYEQVYDCFDRLSDRIHPEDPYLSVIDIWTNQLMHVVLMFDIAIDDKWPYPETYMGWIFIIHDGTFFHLQGQTQAAAVAVEIPTKVLHAISQGELTFEQARQDRKIKLRDGNSYYLHILDEMIDKNSDWRKTETKSVRRMSALRRQQLMVRLEENQGKVAPPQAKRSIWTSQPEDHYIGPSMSEKSWREYSRHRWLHA